MKLGDRPLIAPISIWAHSPDSFKQYVESLRTMFVDHKEAKKERKAKNSTQKVSQFPEGLNLRSNKKGTLILTIRRKPKYITKSEIETLAKLTKTPQNILWQLIRTKSIEVKP